MKTYTSNLASIPSWLASYGDQTGKTLGLNFGFNTDGMFFLGNAGDAVVAYSVRTNFNIPGHQACEVIFTADHTNFCSDQGICFYNDGQSPNWNWDPDPSRIAFSINCPVPHLYGTNKFVNNAGEYYGSGMGPFGTGGSEVLESGIYTFKVTYNPAARTVTAVTYEGSDTSGTVLDTIVLHEKLMDGGPYRIGFDADSDGSEEPGDPPGNSPAYFKSLTINVYETNGISDDEELNNQLSSLKTGYSQVTDLVEGGLFNFSDDADIDDGDGNGIDPNFNQLGLGDVVFIQADGRIVVGGQSGLNDYSRNLRRINVDGTEDESFMPPVFSGGCCDQGYVRDVAQQSDGRLIVVGHFDQVNQLDEDVFVGGIVRLSADGTLNEFACVPGANGYVFVVKVLSDDRILIGGDFSQYNGVNCSRIALLDRDGILDQTFAGNVNLNGAVHAIEVTGDYPGGTLGIIVGGQFNKKITKLDEEGNPNNEFNGLAFAGSIGGGQPRVSSIKVQEDGKVLVGHWFSTYHGVDCGKGLTRLNSDGTLDETFHSELFDDDWNGAHSDDDDHHGGVNTIALQDDGKIIAGGWFDNANGTWKNKIARINSDGSTDDTFDIGFGFSWAGYSWGPRIQDVKLDGDGNVYVAGSFTDYNHAARFQYAKLNTNGALQEWSVLPAFKQMGINDGMNDLYDGANFLNTNLTLPYLYIKCHGGHATGGDNAISGGEGACGCPEAGVLCGLQFNRSIPSTHTQAWDYSPEQDFYDDSAPNNLAEHSYQPVTDSHVMIGDGYFGEGSSYFTAMFPGMFVLAANNINIEQFSITSPYGEEEGGIGTNGSGVDVAEIYPITIGGSTYTAYLKSNYAGNDPSINHIIIVDGNADGIEQFYDPTSQGDEHCLTGLEGKTKLYYLIISKGCVEDLNDEDCGNRMSPTEVQNVAAKFLEAIGISCVSESYELDLSPDHPERLPNYRFYGEGNMDTSVVVDGDKRISLQRTGWVEVTDGCGGRRILSLKDGQAYSTGPEVPDVPPNPTGHPTFQ